MSRLSFFIVACALFTSFTFTFASLVPVVNRDSEIVNLEKRITHTGRGTWYNPGLGNCGWTNTSSQLVLAISVGLFNRNNGGNCGQGVNIQYNGNSAHGTVVDSCQSCGDNDIDMSPALFGELAPTSVGEIQVTWNFVAK